MASWLRIVTITLIVALLAAVGIGTYRFVGLPAWKLYAETAGCTPAAEFTVVTTPAVRATADELVSEFEAATAGFGCRTAHGYVYDVPEDVIITNVAQRWQDGKDFVARRDVGPIPDVWLTESTLPLNRLDDILRKQPPAPSPIAENHSFGIAPLVLANAADAQLPPRSLQAAFAAANPEPGVVRPNPVQSTTGLLATIALYAPPTDTEPVDGADDRVVENELGVAQSRGAFVDGDESAILCRYQVLGDPLPDLLLSEQTVNRFNSGSGRTGPCPPSTAPTRSKKLVVVPTEPTTPTLDHRFVRFSWSTGPDAPPALHAFETWLSSAAGRAAVEKTGLRATVPGDPTSDDLVGRGTITPAQVQAALARYQAARNFRLDLLAVDTSGSMTAPRGGTTRYDTVVRALASAVPALGPQDEVGLWVFPAASGRRPPLVEVAGRAGGAVVDALGRVVPQGKTPLFQTIADAVEYLRDRGGTAERRLIVVSDGEDTSSTISSRTLLDAVRGAGVKIYLITLGDVNCTAVPFAELAESTLGRCFDPGDTGDQLKTAMGG